MKHFLCAAALCLANGASAQEDVYSFSGIWETNWGTVNAFATEDGYQGDYTSDNGLFYMLWDGGMLTGYWVEDQSDVACAYAENGSFYWGRLLLTNSTDAPGFKMKWGYCDGELDRTWSFTRRLSY